MIRPTLATALALLALPLLALVPTAQADDPCASSGAHVDGKFFVVGFFDGNCVGAYAAPRGFDCFPVHWGVFTPFAGVGGHWSCSAMVYVAPGGLGAVVDPAILP